MIVKIDENFAIELETPINNLDLSKNVLFTGFISRDEKEK
jgi:hypothetical protein